MRKTLTIFLSLVSFVTLSQGMTPNVEIYTIPGCLGCNLAKAMFADRHIPYKEISLQGRRDLYQEMKRRAGGDPESSMTVPRIFIQGKYIGGYSDLDASKLDILAASTSSKLPTTKLAG